MFNQNRYLFLRYLWYRCSSVWFLCLSKRKLGLHVVVGEWNHPVWWDWASRAETSLLSLSLCHLATLVSPMLTAPSIGPESGPLHGRGMEDIVVPRCPLQPLHLEGVQQRLCSFPGPCIVLHGGPVLAPGQLCVVLKTPKPSQPQASAHQPMCNPVDKRWDCVSGKVWKSFRTLKTQAYSWGLSTKPRAQAAAIETFLWTRCSAPTDTYRDWKASVMRLMKTWHGGMTLLLTC